MVELSGSQPSIANHILFEFMSKFGEIRSLRDDAKNIE
jgi:hypothetical protein